MENSGPSDHTRPDLHIIVLCQILKEIFLLYLVCSIFSYKRETFDLTFVYLTRILLHGNSKKGHVGSRPI